VRWDRGGAQEIGANDIVRVMDVWTITLMLGVSALWLWLAGAFVVLVKARARA
jgi:hypothetical protein